VRVRDAVTFELGINYWPRRSAMYMWRELDIGEVREDMAQIAGLGFDTVRVFTMAQDFLPEPLTVAADMVANLLEVVRAAKDAGLRVVPTLIVINMSGKFWWPGWMLDAQGRPGDLFSDPTILRTQSMLVETCARALAGESSIRAFDLANEIDDAQRPRTRDAGWLWASLLANTIRRVAPGSTIQIGAHLPSLTTENYMRVDDVGEVADEDLMHAYPLYYPGARSFLDPELVPFSCALTAGLSGRGRAPLMQEFGLCTAPQGSPGLTITDDFLGHPLQQYLASEEEAAEYYDGVLSRLVEIGASGAYAWCYGDYDSRLFDRPPISTAIRERTFGLVRADRSEKPAAAVFRSFRKCRDTAARSGPSLRAEVPRVLDVTADEYYSAPGEHFARLYAKWVAERP
jgi:endo-1,4-beta-mannosidase